RPLRQLSADPEEVAAPTRWSVRQINTAVRLLILALVYILSALSTEPTQSFALATLLVAAAALACARAWTGVAVLLVTAVESVTVVVAVLESSTVSTPLFPYLLAPAFAGGLAAGLTGALVAPGVSGLALVIAGQ